MNKYYGHYNQDEDDDRRKRYIISRCRYEDLDEKRQWGVLTVEERKECDFLEHIYGNRK